MNKIVIACLWLCSTLFFAQKNENRQNDVMISPIELIAAPLLNVSYERLLNENSGLGLNAIFYLGNDDENYSFSQLSPYYRMYFGKKYASGFFVEGFVPITTIKDEIFYSYYYPDQGYFDYSSDTKTKTMLGIGVGFGGKWVAKKNIIFEASVGVGRLFGSDENFTSVTGKGMLGIGYRF